jgi:hypothetical protein
MIAIWTETSVAMSKAILRPSGDQSGVLASPSTRVICRRSRPLGRTVKICVPSAVWLWKAISPLLPGYVACAGEASTSTTQPTSAVTSAVRW